MQACQSAGVTASKSDCLLLTVCAVLCCALLPAAAAAQMLAAARQQEFERWKGHLVGLEAALQAAQSEATNYRCVHVGGRGRGSGLGWGGTSAGHCAACGFVAHVGALSGKHAGI